MRGKTAGVILGALLLVFATRAARAEVVEVRINKLAFVPAQISAHVGDTVEWVNADFVVHTATARNGAWDVIISAHSSGSIVIEADGMVDYYCEHHPNMTGRISVAK